MLFGSGMTAFSTLLCHKASYVPRQFRLAVRPSSEYNNLGLVGKRKQFSFSKTEFDLIYIS
jgi:hypothetical protein